jgi:hypothetical protein
MRVAHAWRVGTSIGQVLHHMRGSYGGDRVVAGGFYGCDDTHRK